MISDQNKPLLDTQASSNVPVAEVLTTREVGRINDKAKSTAILDGLLVIGFQVVGLLVTYAVTLLPVLDSVQSGRFSWLKFPLGILLGAALKALDRKKHEDASPSTGLIDVS